MNMRAGLFGLLLWSMFGYAQVPAAAGPAVVPESKADFEKFSGKVRFVGAVDASVDSLHEAARITFDQLRNASGSATSNALTVWLVLTTEPISIDHPFSGWFIARWNAPHTLAAGDSFVDVDVTVPLEKQPPDGIYYVTVGSYEFNPACGYDYCYDDLHPLPTRVRIYQGNYYVYSGPPQPGMQAAAIEFFHAGMGHYFVSAQEDEIVALDTGIFPGWTRTGQSFNVWTSGSGLADVCRFFTTYFAPKSSHFYTAISVECEGLKSSAVWQYEKLAFKVAFPSADGACPVGIPLYRLYNEGQTGAPNHRYTTSMAIRAEMIAQGFVPEDANTVCVASAGGP